MKVHDVLIYKQSLLELQRKARKARRRGKGIWTQEEIDYRLRKAESDAWWAKHWQEEGEEPNCICQRVQIEEDRWEWFRAINCPVDHNGYTRSVYKIGGKGVIP